MRISRTRFLEIIRKITRRVQKSHKKADLELRKEKFDWACGLSMSKQKFLHMAHLFWKNFTPECNQLLEYYLNRYNEEQVLDLNNVIIEDEKKALDCDSNSPLQQNKVVEIANESLQTVGELSLEKSKKLNVLRKEANALFDSHQQMDTVKSCRFSNSLSVKASIGSGISQKKRK